MYEFPHGLRAKKRRNIQRKRYSPLSNAIGTHQQGRLQPLFPNCLFQQSESCFASLVWHEILPQETKYIILLECYYNLKIKGEKYISIPDQCSRVMVGKLCIFCIAQSCDEAGPCDCSTRIAGRSSTRKLTDLFLGKTLSLCGPCENPLWYNLA